MGTRPNVLWMGDLEPYMDAGFVRNAYEQLGHSVVDVRLINNKHTGMPAAYCFVEFKDAESAQKAMFQLNSKIIPNTANRVRFKLNHASYGREHLNQQEYSIYVAGLSEEVDDYAFYQCFIKKFPSTVSAKVVVDANGKSRGYGFVRFRLEEERERAMKEMQRYIGLGTNPIHVSLAQAKRTYSSTNTTSSYNNSSSNNTSTTSSTDYSKAWSQYNQHHHHQQQQQYNNQYQDPYAAQWNQYNQYYGGGQGQYPGYDMSQGGGYDYSGQGGGGGYDYSQMQHQQQQPQQHDYQNNSGSGSNNNAASSSANNSTAGKDSDDELQDPELTVDVDKMNEEFMAKSEELYLALERSRWHPLDNVFSTISGTVQS